MSEFDDKNAIDELMKRVEQLNDADKQSLINSIKNMNTTNKKVEQTDEEKAAKKQDIEKQKKQWHVVKQKRLLLVKSLPHHQRNLCLQTKKKRSESASRMKNVKPHGRAKNNNEITCEL